MLQDPPTWSCVSWGMILPRRPFAIASAVVLVIGCARDPRPVPGHERGDCRAAATGSGSGSAVCDPGLLCLSNLCVRPPPADCGAVAEQLASIDLGNYAEPEQRAPVIAKYRASCEAAHVTKEEGACLDKARDKWSAGKCVPRMFPELASSSTKDCHAVAERIRATVAGQIGSNSPEMGSWFETVMREIEASCEQDAWPPGLKRCILDAPPTKEMEACNAEMPAALQAKLQERISAAMRQQGIK
jgi:hypothetical protein